MFCLALFCKMAECDRLLILSAPLCFLFSKLGRLDLRKIKDIMIDNFVINDIATAKKRLFDDIDDISTLNVENIPKHKARRNSDVRVRTAKEIDDMIEAASLLDENNLLEKLPRYVIDNTDSIPTMRLEEGELNYFCQKLDKFEGLLNDLHSNVNKLQHDVNSATHIHSRAGATNTAEKFKSSNNGNAVHDFIRSMRNTESNNHLSASDIPHDTDSPGDFEVVESRRKKRRKRSKEHDAYNNSIVGITTDANVVAPNINVGQVTGVLSFAEAAKKPATDNGNINTNKSKVSKFRKPLIIGKQQAVQTLDEQGNPGHSVTAARPLLSKAVYCIDNVNNNLSADDLHSFVSSMSVRVISCFEVKPRRSIYQRRNNYSPTDHKTFRLCINREDSEYLLDADKWPADITISAWFFKSTTTATSSSADNANGQSSSSAVLSSVNNMGLLVVGEAHVENNNNLVAGSAMAMDNDNLSNTNDGGE